MDILSKELLNKEDFGVKRKASLVVQLVKNPPHCGRPAFNPWVGKIP